MESHCRWCGCLIPFPDHQSNPKMFVIGGIAHMEPHRSRKKLVEKNTAPEQPLMFWKDVTERARKFFDKNKGIENIPEPTEVIAA